jgi:putative membrane protein
MQVFSALSKNKECDMLWLKAFHIIFMVCWFAGLFYLPRLFVYHAMATDTLSIERFKLMERRLYRGITTPCALLTTLLGIGMLSMQWGYYMTQGWMHTKLGLLVLLWAYHLSLGYYRQQFARDENTRSDVFFRVLNEIPLLFLIPIVILAIVKPF